MGFVFASCASQTLEDVFGVDYPHAGTRSEQPSKQASGRNALALGRSGALVCVRMLIVAKQGGAALRLRWILQMRNEKASSLVGAVQGT